MRLPFILLKDKLQEYIVEYESHVQCEKSTEAKDKFSARAAYQVVRYQAEMNYPRDVFLVGYGCEFTDTCKGYGLISIGEASEEVRKNNDVICIKPGITVEEVYGKLLDLFISFQTLEQKMQQVLFRRVSLQALFELIYPYFGNPMMIHDNNFYKLASVGLQADDPVFEENNERRKIKIAGEVLEEFQLDKEYQESLKTKGPAYFPDEMFGVRILYTNIRINGIYKGRICINEENRPFCESDNWLLHWFTMVVTEAFQHELAEEKNKMQPLVAMLSKMLAGEYPSRTQMDQVLLHYGWTSQDDYLCACFFDGDYRRSQGSLQYKMESISREFPQSCIFLHENIIVLVFNTTIGDVTADSFRMMNSKKVREGLMKMGISSVNRDLMKFPYFYRQACAAYQVGGRQDETFWTYCFEDYKSEFILLNALDQLPVQFLSHEAILKLKEYDKDHPSDLCRTLRIYLENERNIARTSEILDIHRTSLLYRIRRVVEITKVNLEDSNTRFELLQSYRLWAKDYD